MSIKKAGQSLGQTKRREDFLVRRVAENFPFVERASDLFSCPKPFVMEFRTYGVNNNVRLSLQLLNRTFSECIGNLEIVQSAHSSVGTVPNQLIVDLVHNPEPCNILVAMHYREVRPDTAPGAHPDGSTHPWTQHFWEYGYSSTQYGGPGDGAGFGMWSRRVVRGENYRVLRIPYTNRAGVWVFEIKNATVEGASHENYITGSYGTLLLPTIDNPYGSLGHLIGGAAIQCTGYGTIITVTTVGPELIDSNIQGKTYPEIGQILAPPYCWGVLTSPSGVSAMIDGPGTFTSYGIAAGALLLKDCSTTDGGDMAYPTGVKVYIDGKDATYYLFNTKELNPTDDLNTWRDMDITTYIRKTPGIHTVEVVPVAGAGRADIRLEIR